ncbi:hypothetical protein [Winogradskyella thalassocola]|uniref:CarboxypepD_reg-like domain-containing protein n=1 Tax=Winogradskyella thalassocola TaxID=262004 RepID=A0A1G8D0M7_9FLAO|nr:hypothetical protein [Winogradskyella thalassocola]SDH51104.1 hypothetical protein SAMN04489796_10390 [Winogradskyella thalassocola]
MRKITILIFLLCLPFVHFAQTLNGKVYDATGTVKNIKIFNETQNRVTLTNEDGNFSINAKVNDTISFQSLFYHPKAIALKAFHFDGTAVFELKEILTELDEVEVKAESEQPVFVEETYNIELKKIIQEDIKNHPEKYKPAGATYGPDIFAIIGLVANLLKKKDKYIAPTYQPITYTQMDSLFSKSSFFNTKLITDNLKIPADKKYLFFDFCDAKQMSSKLLKEENKMQFLEELVVSSQLFLILLDEYGEKSVKQNKD